MSSHYWNFNSKGRKRFESRKRKVKNRILQQPLFWITFDICMNTFLPFAAHANENLSAWSVVQVFARHMTWSMQSFVGASSSSYSRIFERHKWNNGMEGFQCRKMYGANSKLFLKIKKEHSGFDWYPGARLKVLLPPAYHKCVPCRGHFHTWTSPTTADYWMDSFWFLQRTFGAFQDSKC